MEIVQIICIEEPVIARLTEIKRDFPQLNKAILSSVVDINTDLLAFLNSEFDFFIEFNHHTAVPIENLYESKETLGLDRLARSEEHTSELQSRQYLVCRL